ncbi:DUF3347 domain-containing protein [Pontibacter chitinilyticus]|uniref:DUF3347 domain-containing protein n=1 Tax=Pontibacter chitinilyticus TaxID=2674989 RepID=UPI003219C87C
MNKSLLTAAVLSVFAFSSCTSKSSENQKTATAAAEQHENMDMGNMQETPATEVVKTPAYGDVAEPFKTQVSQLLEEYLQLKDALVASDAAAAKKAAEDVLAVANALPEATLTGDQKQFAEEKIAQVKETATKIAAATDVEVQRQSLEPLSEATFAMTKAFDASNQTLYYQHCPMANNNEGAYWVSASEEIRNPYLGDRMLTCGSNEEVLR